MRHEGCSAGLASPAFVSLVLLPGCQQSVVATGTVPTRGSGATGEEAAAAVQGGALRICLLQGEGKRRRKQRRQCKKRVSWGALLGVYLLCISITERMVLEIVISLSLNCNRKLFSQFCKKNVKIVNC